MADTFGKLTQRARTVLTLAQEEAQRLGSHSLGTEHLLFGLVREGDGVAARVLSNLGVRSPEVQVALERMEGQGKLVGPEEIELSREAKQMMEQAAREMRRLHHHYIGTEHLLLGLVDEPRSAGAALLMSLGVDLEQVRQQIMEVVNPPSGVHVSPSAPVSSLPALGDLRWVIPIAETQTKARMTLTLLSLEVYTQGMIIHTRFVSAEKPPITEAPRPPRHGFLAKDDLGRAYEGMLSAVSNDRQAWYFSYHLVPGLAQRARVLEVEKERGRWTFAISLPREEEQLR